MEENDDAAPFIDKYLEAGPALNATHNEIVDAVQTYLTNGGMGDYDRILARVRSRYPTGSFRREGKQFRGYLGVGLRSLVV